jgi:hypothetical protein
MRVRTVSLSPDQLVGALVSISGAVRTLRGGRLEGGVDHQPLEQCAGEERVVPGHGEQSECHPELIGEVAEQTGRGKRAPARGSIRCHSLQALQDYVPVGLVQKGRQGVFSGRVITWSPSR